MRSLCDLTIFDVGGDTITFKTEKKSGSGRQAADYFN